MAYVWHLIGQCFDLFKFLVWGLNDFVKINDFKLFKIFFELVFNEFINFSESFPESWVEMVFYAVVGSKLVYEFTFLLNVRR